jgi:DNA repair exonuclease SbcCD nuclease subunit
MKFLHAADIHLDSPLRGLERYDGAPVDELRGATRLAFENLIDLAIQEEVAFVLLVGDLYDGDWKDYNTGLFFVHQISRLREAGIPAYIVAGNHDAASQITKSLKPPDNMHIFSTSRPESLVREELGIAIHGQGFATRAVTEDLAAAYPHAHSGLLNIGLLHTSLDGRPGHAPYAPCSIDGLTGKGYDYWALGHVHQREIVSENPWIVYPGNIQGRHVRESGVKGCTLVSVDNREIASVDHRALDVVRWESLVIDTTDLLGAAAILDKVRVEIERATDAADGRLVAARITLAGQCSENRKLRVAREQVTAEFRALANEYGQGRFWVEKVRIDTEPVQALKDAMERDDALGGLLRAIHDLEVDTDRLSALSEEVANLRNKLPAEVLMGEDAFDPTDGDTLRALLPDIKEILIDELLRSGGTE